MPDDSSYRDLRDIEQPGEHPRLSALLHEWVEWQHSGGCTDLKMSTSRFWHSGSSSFDEMVENVDRRDAFAVDAAINDLPPLQRMAISNTHLNTLWRPNRPGVDLQETYKAARIALSAGLKKRHIP